jgi:hypothetical protein
VRLLKEKNEMLDQTPIRQATLPKIEEKRGEVGRSDIRIPHHECQFV